MKKMILDNLKHQLRKQYENIREKPSDILKRIEQKTYSNKNDRNDGVFATGKPCTGSILVRILKSSLGGGDVDKEEISEESEEEDDLDDGKSAMSKQSKKSQAKSVKSGKSKTDIIRDKQRKRIEKEERKKQRDMNPDSPKYHFFEETFRISKITDI